MHLLQLQLLDFRNYTMNGASKAYYIVYVVRFLHVICVSCANLPQARAGIENQTGRFRKCHKKPTNFGPTPFLQNGVKAFLKTITFEFLKAWLENFEGWATLSFYYDLMISRGGPPFQMSPNFLDFQMWATF